MPKKKLAQFPVEQRFSAGERIRWAFQKNIDLNLKTPARFVLVHLASYASWSTLRAWPSVMTICRETGLSKSSVLRALVTLEDAGLIQRWKNYKVGRSGRASNGYKLLIRRTDLTKSEIIMNRMRIAEQESLRRGEEFLREVADAAPSDGPLQSDTQNRELSIFQVVEAECLSVRETPKPKPVDKGSKATGEADFEG